MPSKVTRHIAFAAVAALLIAQSPAPPAPDAMLQRGIASYRAGQYADAARDLRAAADAMLSNDQMQVYVNTGKFPNLDQVETALVYLTLAENKLGHEAQAKEAVLRLETAERIEATYAKLPLEADAADFPKVAARLVPGTKLAQTAPQTATATTAPPPAAEPAVVPAPPPAATATAVQTESAADRDRAIEAAIAAERARIQREADQRVAAEHEAAQREAAQQIAASQSQTQVRTDYLVRLRQADAYADNGQMNRADQMYVSIANEAGAPRDIVAEAGVGLYRISAFADAVSIFRRMAPFARGEEDLRYYNAVSLYETGDFAAARRELVCALPFIEQNDEVVRYRAKIEQTAALSR